VSFLSFAQDVDSTNPYKMIEQVAKNTFSRLDAQKKEITENPNILKTVIRDEMLPYINYRYAAFKVLGTNFNQKTMDENERFADIFRDYMVTSYAQIFTLYDGQKIEFESTKDFSKNKIVSVTTKVLGAGRPEIQIDFKAKLNTKTGEWAVFDIVAEGISMLDSKQAELNSIIRQKGLTAVGEMLQEKSTRDITYDKQG
jgi:phospholipid transport system substrate-binding protein